MLDNRMTAERKRRPLKQAGAWVRRHWKSLLLAIGAVALVGGLCLVLWVFDPVSYPAGIVTLTEEMLKSGYGRPGLPDQTSQGKSLKGDPFASERRH